MAHSDPILSEYGDPLTVGAWIRSDVAVSFTVLASFYPHWIRSDVAARACQACRSTFKKARVLAILSPLSLLNIYLYIYILIFVLHISVLKKNGGIDRGNI